MLLDEFVFKIASRCNLNCSYCYMYNMGDNTYLKQPKVMSIDTVHAFARALKRHCQNNAIRRVDIAFHGGEPLLAGKDLIRETVKIINETVVDVEVKYVIQTNGTLLDDDWMDLFNELDIQVGISIDGPKKFHDMYRVYHNNKGSFDEVVKGVNVRNNKSIGGLISVVNIKIPPKDLFDFYLSLNARSVNLLLPDCHYDNLPDGMAKLRDKREAKYGDWLIELYDIWVSYEKKGRPKIPYFENIIGMILGLEKGDELIGKRKNKALTIETDGAIEVVDPLRICENGFTRNELNVHKNEISDIEELPIYQMYYNSHERLCAKCNACPIQTICGGGYLGHRYSRSNGFDNASIYCNDIMKMVSHIQRDIFSILPENILHDLHLEAISYDELFEQTNTL